MGSKSCTDLGSTECGDNCCVFCAKLEVCLVDEDVHVCHDARVAMEEGVPKEVFFCAKLVDSEDATECA